MYVVEAPESLFVCTEIYGGKRPMADTSVGGNELSASMWDGKFFDQLTEN
jgi:hypothetical protein